jgi:anthranilate phosphoribosyltransferase
VQPVRKELKLRTIFNLLGPLTNPAGATAQIAGAYSVRAAELIAGALAALGLQRGFVFHGSDGLDEVTTTGSTEVFSVENGAVQQSTITPEEMGLPRAHLSNLQGGDPAFNAEITRAVLGGKSGPERDIVVANAAWGFLAAAKTTNLKEAIDLAKESIDSGSAQGKLHQLCAFSAPFSSASSARI